MTAIANLASWNVRHCFSVRAGVNIPSYLPPESSGQEFYQRVHTFLPRYRDRPSEYEKVQGLTVSSLLESYCTEAVVSKAHEACRETVDGLNNCIAKYKKTWLAWWADILQCSTLQRKRMFNLKREKTIYTSGGKDTNNIGKAYSPHESPVYQIMQVRLIQVIPPLCASRIDGNTYLGPANYYT